MTVNDPRPALAAMPAARLAPAAGALAAQPGGGGRRMTKHDNYGRPHDET